jgi:hypothetical protein
MPYAVGPLDMHIHISMNVAPTFTFKATNQRIRVRSSADMSSSSSSSTSEKPVQCKFVNSTLVSAKRTTVHRITLENLSKLKPG